MILLTGTFFSREVAEQGYKRAHEALALLR